MAFQTALSGLNAAQQNLNVTGNNIANSSTTGFKKSRAEFADIYANNFASSSQVGSGVQVANIAQQFSQGNIEFTENSLDLAISGEGFFVLKDTDDSLLYTRAGAFGVDREGYVVNSLGQRLQSYDVDANGVATNFTAEDLQLSTSASPASATDNIDLNLNLDASVTPPYGNAIDPDNPNTYNFSTSTTIYDSLGDSHTATLFFQQAAATTDVTVEGTIQPSGGPYPAAGSVVNTTVYDSQGQAYPATLTYTETAADQWQVDISIPDASPAPINQTATVDYTTTPPTVANNIVSNLDFGNGGTPVDVTFDLAAVTQDPGAATVAVTGTSSSGPDNEWNVLLSIDGQIHDTEVLNFNADGSLATNPATIDFTDTSGLFNPGNGATSMSLSVDLTGSTQFAGESAVNSVVQNGYTTGRLSGIDIDDKGVVFARFTNGQSELLGAVALANFANPQGLQPVGDTNWAATFEAGDVLPGQAGTGNLGQIQSGSLESSNVDLSKQLVNMIIAQRDFQANAKMISTEDEVTQSIINIR